MDKELLDQLIQDGVRLGYIAGTIIVFLKVTRRSLEDAITRMRASRDDAVEELKEHRERTADQIDQLYATVERLETRIETQEAIIREQAKLITKYQKRQASDEIRITQLEALLKEQTP